MSAKRGAKKDEATETEERRMESEGVHEEISLEERLRRLDAIVGALEGGEIELERGLALFEEGVKHIRAADALLSHAELRVEEMIGEAGALSTRAWEGKEG